MIEIKYCPPDYDPKGSAKNNNGGSQKNSKPEIILPRLTMLPERFRTRFPAETDQVENEIALYNENSGMITGVFL